jgi:hypothetical protein
MGMREEFELHYAEEFERACGRKPSPEQMVSMREGDEYGADRGYLNGYWKGWQASRAALVVELPKGGSMWDDEPIDVGRDAVCASLTDAGVSYK